jgi:hypothetical protein
MMANASRIAVTTIVRSGKSSPMTVVRAEVTGENK